MPADLHNDIVCDSKQMLLTDKTYVIREDEDDIALPYFYYQRVPLSQIGLHVNCNDRLIGNFAMYSSNKVNVFSSKPKVLVTMYVSQM